MTRNERLPYRWKVLISVIFGIFMVILDTTVVNVAFQALRREFDAGVTEAQWVISIYVLALGIATPMAGFLADRFGIKRIYLTGLAVFVVGSFLCGVAPRLWFLVGARALQGLGGGLCIPLGTAQLLRAFPAREQGKALGIFGIALVVAPALGPILGGLLVDLDLWNWIFFLNVPIGGLGLWLASRFLREEGSRREPIPDWLGLATEIVGFGAVLYAASIAERLGWSDPRVLFWFGIGAAGLAAFAWVELRVAREPLLDLRLFRHPTFLVASLVGYVSVMALYGAEFLLPVYLQALRGYAALDAGLVLLPMAVSAGIAMPIAGRWFDRVGPRPLVVLGFLLLSVNTWQFSRLDASTPISWIAFLLVLRGLALGLTVQTTMVTALSVVSGADLPRGSSLVNASRQVVQSVGVAILATILASTLSPASRTLQHRLEAQLEEGRMFGLCQPATLAPAIAPGGLPVSGGPGGIPAAAGDAPERSAASALERVCTESLAGFSRAYRITFYFSVIAILLGLLLPGWPRRWSGRAEHGTHAEAVA